MNFARLVSLVIQETTRPDLGFVEDGGSGEIPNKIQAAIYRAHTLDDFYKDILEARVVFPFKQYIQTLDTNTLPRFRDTVYIRKNDKSVNASYYSQEYLTVQGPNLPPLYGTAVGAYMHTELDFFEYIDPSAIFDDYHREKTNVAYQAGTSINMKSDCGFQHALVGYYAFPQCDDISNRGANVPESWIMKEYPYAIIYFAASAVFNSIGQQDQSRKYDDSNTGLRADVESRLIKNNITAGQQGVGR